jgi:large subunit ribosomal protein L21
VLLFSSLAKYAILPVLEGLRGSEIYAIVETGGKQYRVTSGQALQVERLDVAEGSTVELDRVLLIADGDKVTVGSPTIEGAKVLATSHGEDRGKKIIVFRYKSKTRHSNKTGHRQPFTKLTIDTIIAPGTAGAEAAKPARRRSSTAERTEEKKEDGA